MLACSFSASRLLALAALLGAAAVVRADDFFTGDMTSYTLSSPSSGNCNFMAAPSAASQNYAALNAAQWDSTKNCGRCAEVSCADSRCKDTTSTQLVYILDQCPECKSGDLDVSPSVFKTLTGSDPSRYTIKWKFVDCPVTGNIKYCLKSGSNPYYTAVQPANAAAGVKSVTINSKATTMVPSAYYYLLESNLDLSAVKVSVTSLSGQTISETVSLTAGSCTTGSSQFTSSGSTPSSPTVTPAPTTKAPATSAPSPATTVPTTPTTTAPAATAAPATTTSTPASTTSAPAATTSAPASTTTAPASTTTAPASTTTAPATTPTATSSAPAASPTTSPSPSANTTWTPKKPTKAKKSSHKANAANANNAANAGGYVASDETSAPSPTKKSSCNRRLDDY